MENIQKGGEYKSQIPMTNVQRKAMKLTIDTSNVEKIILKIDGKKYETEGTRRSSQKLLPFLMEVVEKEGKKVTDVTEIETVQGSGSFTGLRVGVSVANTLGYLLQIPVNGKFPDKGEFAEIHYS